MAAGLLDPYNELRRFYAAKIGMTNGPFRRIAPFHSDFGLCDKPSPHDAVKSLSRMRLHCVSQARKIPFAGEPRQMSPRHSG